MQDRASSASKQTPFHQRPGFLKICLAVVSIAFLWVVFAEDHEDWEDFADEAYMVDPWAIPGSSSGMPDVAAQPGFIQAPRGGYQDYSASYAPRASGYQQMPSQADYGYGEPGGFRGEAQIGGVPMVSGTIDQSGEGNHVFSVGGKVIELP